MVVLPHSVHSESLGLKQRQRPALLALLVRANVFCANVGTDLIQKCGTQSSNDGEGFQTTTVAESLDDNRSLFE